MAEYLMRENAPWRVWAVDPGAVATGMAWLSKDGTMHQAFQTGEPVEAYRYLMDNVMLFDYVLVEDYSHGGTFTKEAKATIEILGLFKYGPFLGSINPRIRHKDKRLSGQGEAAKLMGGTVADLKKADEYKDAFSALAHCVVFLREWNNGTGTR